MPTTQEEIQAKTTELDALLTEADSHIRAFIQATAQAIREQALPIAKAIGKAQPAASTRLGNDGLKAFVAEVAQYAAAAQSISEKCIYKKTAWYSLAWKDRVRYQHHSRGSGHFSGVPVNGDRVSNHILDALIPLGEILQKKGFSTSGDRYEIDTYDIPHVGIWRHFKWSEDMKTNLKRYQETDNKIHTVQREIDTLNEKKLKDEAANLWDSVP